MTEENNAQAINLYKLKLVYCFLRDSGYSHTLGNQKSHETTQAAPPTMLTFLPHLHKASLSLFLYFLENILASGKLYFKEKLKFNKT